MKARTIKPPEIQEEKPRDKNNKTKNYYNNLLHHHHFLAEKREILNFKKYLWRKIYAEKNLYTMGAITLLLMVLIMSVLISFEKGLLSNIAEVILGITTLFMIGIYFLSFPLVRRYYKKQPNNPNNQYFFTSLQGSMYIFSKQRNSKGGEDYVITKH